MCRLLRDALNTFLKPRKTISPTIIEDVVYRLKICPQLLIRILECRPYHPCPFLSLFNRENHIPLIDKLLKHLLPLFRVPTRNKHRCLLPRHREHHILEVILETTQSASRLLKGIGPSIGKVPRGIHYTIEYPIGHFRYYRLCRFCRLFFEFLEVFECILILLPLIAFKTAILALKSLPDLFRGLHHRDSRLLIPNHQLIGCTQLLAVGDELVDVPSLIRLVREFLISLG